jgi:hypothetical protein
VREWQKLRREQQRERSNVRAATWEQQGDSVLVEASRVAAGGVGRARLERFEGKFGW